MKGALRMDTESVMLTLCEYLDLSKNAPLKDNLFDAFKKAIILGTVPAGTNINEKQLADALHISRTPSAPRSTSLPTSSSSTVSPASA